MVMVEIEVVIGVIVVEEKERVWSGGASTEGIEADIKKREHHLKRLQPISEAYCGSLNTYMMNGIFEPKKKSWQN